MKLAVVGDLLEENWPSMELAADTITEAVNEAAPGRLAAEVVRPAMRRRFTSAEQTAGKRFNADRLLNRFWDYPRWLRARRGEFQLFHLADHSYAQLALELTPERTVVTCHDVDTFRCLWEPQAGQSRVYKMFARRSLKGLRRAARVLCVSQATADELLAQELVAQERLRVAPLPVHPLFLAAPGVSAVAEAEKLLSAVGGGPYLLHVGSNIPRKRMDVLLRVFAGLRRQWPEARLWRVGGGLAREQRALAEELGVAEHIVTLPPLARETLAEVYRRADVTLLPSEREGFGWPVAESLAVGTPVVASDLPALREVGGTAAEYAPVGDVACWVSRVEALWREKQAGAAAWETRRNHIREHGGKFSRAVYARSLLAIYGELLKF